MRDQVGAGQIRARVLAPDYPVHYELNIGVPGCLNFIAEEVGIVVGFITVLLSVYDAQGQDLWRRLAPYIAFIGVLPEYQGKRIGTCLLQCAIRETATLCPNSPVLYLEHAPENDRARGVFEKCGFKALPREDVFKVTALYPKGPVMFRSLDTVRKN
jgi:ribosomal protein S18 acetylase RimI-like enzyme